MDWDINWNEEDQTWILTDGHNKYDLADWSYSVFGRDCPEAVLKVYADECLSAHGRAPGNYCIDGGDA